MKNRYSPILVIILVFGLVWVFLLATVMTEQKKGGKIMDKKTMVEDARKR